MSSGKQFPRLGSAVVVIQGDSILLGVRGKEPNRGKWVLPGGKIHPFESITEAGRREILEETGLDVEIGGTLTVREIIDPPSEHRLIVFSSATPVGGQLRPSSDLDDVRFWHRWELGTADLSPVVADVLDELGWLDQEPLAA